MAESPISCPVCGWVPVPAFPDDNPTEEEFILAVGKHFFLMHPDGVGNG